ncbi:MAG: GNAT family N-acetyltransferase [Stenotrophomonas nitritireducens]|nr:GNAT family N-acetyltransferase [Stenotrophomonas nitritireducens]MBN8791368.1 GNAT family N-acetyltransferase [Stenotrophomonas nitritireducens]MBN8795310.1 GNAT family N-acetyltransferase [Stenotrophomonas nitritireducens]
MKIVNLQDRRDLVPAIAAAHVQAFGTLLPDWTVAQAVAELQAQQRNAIPCSWLAMDAGDWSGSVSLLHDDHEQIRGWSPWLASLYVKPEARGRGVGAALVEHAIAQAAVFGVPELYLYCEAPRVAWYRTLGWRVHAQLQLGPLAITVMAVETGHR